MGVPLSKARNREDLYNAKGNNWTTTEEGSDSDEDDGKFALHNFEYKKSNTSLARETSKNAPKTKKSAKNDIEIYIPRHTVEEHAQPPGTQESDMIFIEDIENFEKNEIKDSNERSFNEVFTKEDAVKLASEECFGVEGPLNVLDFRDVESEEENSRGPSPSVIDGGRAQGVIAPTAEVPEDKTEESNTNNGSEEGEDVKSEKAAKNTVKTTSHGAAVDVNSSADLLPSERDYSSAMTALMRKSKPHNPTNNLVHSRRERRDRPRNHGRNWGEAGKALLGIPESKSHVIHVKPAEEQEEKDNNMARMRYERSVSRMAALRGPYCGMERGAGVDWDREEINAALDPMEATLRHYTGPTYVETKLNELNSRHRDQGGEMVEDAELEAVPSLECFMEMEFGRLESVKQRMPTFFRYTRNYY